MPKIPIPDDWDGETWGCFLIEWPVSIEWVGLLQGFITTPIRGRFWDERTGSILDVQRIGREIEERNEITMSCQELVNQLSIIAQAIVSVNVAVNQQVVVNQSLVNATIANANATALSNSFANAISAAYANATLIQNLSVDIRNFGLPYPPITPEEAEPIGLTANANTNETACDAAYWIVSEVLEIVQFLDDRYNTFYFSSRNALLAYLAQALTWAGKALTGNNLVQMPPSALTEIVESLWFLDEAGLLENALQVIRAFVNDNFDDLVCILVNAFDNGETLLAQNGIREFATLQGISDNLLPFLNSLFNVNTIAYVFLEPISVVIPARPIGYECCPSPGQ